MVTNKDGIKATPVPFPHAYSLVLSLLISNPLFESRTTKHL